jgi:hypothetical protein
LPVIWAKELSLTSEDFAECVLWDTFSVKAVNILDARKVDLAANFFEGAVLADLPAAARDCEDVGDIHRQVLEAEGTFRDVGVHFCFFGFLAFVCCVTF